MRMSKTDTSLRDMAIYTCHIQGRMNNVEIASKYNLSPARVGQIINGYKQERNETPLFKSLMAACNIDKHSAAVVTRAYNILRRHGIHTPEQLRDICDKCEKECDKRDTIETFNYRNAGVQTKSLLHSTRMMLQERERLG